jgi:hypothetical protein
MQRFLIIETNTSNSCLKRESKKPATFALWQRCPLAKKRAAIPITIGRQPSKARRQSLKSSLEERPDDPTQKGAWTQEISILKNVLENEEGRIFFE